MEKYIFFVAYFSASVLHIYACMPPEREPFRKVTKCFLMPLLSCCYIVTAGNFSPLVLIAVLCGFAGDVFLLGQEKTAPFACGLFSFAAGHVLYSVYMWKKLSASPGIWAIVIAGSLFLLGIVFSFRILWPRMPKAMFAPCLLYMLDICFMSLSALLFALDKGGLGWVAFAGSLLFVFSDSVLAYSTFRRRIPCRHLIVMITYLLAQSMLVFTFAHLGA